jgi:hypothetical protein
MVTWTRPTALSTRSPRSHLEIFQTTHGLRRPGQTAADGGVDAVGRRSHDLDHAVGVIAHHVHSLGSPDATASGASYGVDQASTLSG